jgi:hypothetical protein
MVDMNLGNPKSSGRMPEAVPTVTAHPGFLQEHSRVNTASARPRPLRPFVALLVVLTLALGTVVAGAAAPARAAAGDIAGATLSWGVKASFRNYISGPIANGSIVTSGNVVNNGAFDWTGGAGSEASGTVGYTGSVHFTGHSGMLDLTISNVRIAKASDAAATIVADVVSKGLGSGEFVTYSGVTFADVDLASGQRGTTAGVTSVSGAPATLTAAGAEAFAGFYDAGAELDSVSFSWPVEQAAEPEPEPEPEPEEPAPSAPTVTVSKTTGLDASGETITVSGSGFGVEQHPTVVGTRPPLAGQWSGAYVIFGSFADTWKPSEGAARGSRVGFEQRWLLPQATIDANPAVFAEEGIPVAADGTFSFEVNVAEHADALADGNYGIYTYAAGGPVYAPFETYTPLSFGEEGETSLVVSPSTEVNAGDELDVTISMPAELATNAGTPTAAGAYLMFCTEPEAGVRPTGAACDASLQQWLLSAPAYGQPASGTVADGWWTVETTITVPATIGDTECADGACGVFVRPDHRFAASESVHDRFVAIEYASDEEPVDPDPGTPGTPGTPTTPTTPAPAVPVTAGMLNWGIKQAFVSYVTGPIARGSIALSGGAGANGGRYAFPQGSADGFDRAAGVGSVDYRGSVAFSGHSGALALTIANPSITVTNASSATLTATVGGTRVAFATLALGAGGRAADASGAVTFSNVPATLTAAGANAFAGFYSAGTALDAVTFTVGAPNGANASGGSGSVVAAFAPTVKREPAATPPALDGIQVTAGDVEPGGTVTITADGFQPNEEDILVVLYSEPTVLDRDATADASGVVTWTGTLPSDFSGEHTLTLQGSVSRGIVIDFGDAMIRTLALDACEVTDATLTWGFKEAFRSYISGTIANGEWTVAEGAAYETPNFIWGDGTGGYDPEAAEGELAFAGTVNFTGHGGILNTTVGNPRIEFVDADTARLYLDMSGTTQEGEAVDQADVHFADIDLSAGTVEHAEGVSTITAAPAELSDEGSAAIGTYEPGTELDPITVEFMTDAACGSVEEAEAVDTEVETAPVTDDGPGVLPWVIGGLVLLALIALVIMLVVRRRGASEA